MDQYLTLNDGTVIQDSFVLEDGNILRVYVYSNMDFGVLFNLLNDPEKVEEIKCTRYGNEQTVTGYTELYCISKEPNGSYSAGIRK